MLKLLWISAYAPYDTVNHAGGQVHNYLVKAFSRNIDIKIRLLSFCYEEETEKLDLDAYGIENKIFVIRRNLGSRVKRAIWKVLTGTHSFDSCAGLTSAFRKRCLKREVKRYRIEKYQPDVIILQWTEIIMMRPLISLSFPKAKIVCIEEDVTFLRAYRGVQEAAGLSRLVLQKKFLHLKARELSAVREADLIVTNNSKDQKLLYENGIIHTPLMVVPPYFKNMNSLTRKPKNMDLLFYGAMYREENYKCALWFIEHVFPRVLKEFPEARFVVVGANPPKQLKDCMSDRIVITGFVEEVMPYFSTCRCFVAPLQKGAGIKVKVLEALSAGIPVLTNEIGIEGIPAEEGRDYLHCETPDDFLAAIKEIFTSDSFGAAIGSNGRKFIIQNYNIERMCAHFMDIVLGLVKEEGK